MIQQVYDSFENVEEKKKYVAAIVKTMRENKIDIRKFSFDQLSSFIDIVTTHQ